MIRLIVLIICYYFFTSCATSSSSIESNAEIIDDSPIILSKSINFPLDYEVFNISNDEDIKLLINRNPIFFKKRYDRKLKKQLVKNRIKLLKEQATYKIDIKQLTFKEFKIQVSGPEVNVATVRVDYVLTTPTLDTLMFNEVNRESIPDFKEVVFKEMCDDLSKETMVSLSEFIK